MIRTSIKPHKNSKRDDNNSDNGNYQLLQKGFGKYKFKKCHTSNVSHKSIKPKLVLVKKNKIQQSQPEIPEKKNENSCISLKI